MTAIHRAVPTQPAAANRPEVIGPDEHDVDRGALPQDEADLVPAVQRADGTADAGSRELARPELAPLVGAMAATTLRLVELVASVAGEDPDGALRGLGLALCDRD